MALKDDFDYYVAHQAELVAKYNGKVVVIKDKEVLGAFDSEIEAITETSKNHPIGSFLVHKCGPGEENYSASFHSRVSFA